MGTRSRRERRNRRWRSRRSSLINSRGSMKMLSTRREKILIFSKKNCLSLEMNIRF